MKEKIIKFMIHFIAIVITISLFLFLFYGIKENIFDSSDGLMQYVRQFGLVAPLIFILVQILQVVFPIIPGGASCLVGVLLFGGFYGFIYNYIGLCIGSFCNFLLARHFGSKAFQYLLKKESINRYLSTVKSEKFKQFFWWGIVLPGAPDDLLCYVAGLSNLSFLSFFIIIILGKPPTLLFYSLFSHYFSL